MWGTTLDHVFEVKVVAATGQILKATETQNYELFCALRGAGSSFSIMTQFTVCTQPEPDNVLDYT